MLDIGRVVRAQVEQRVQVAIGEELSRYLRNDGATVIRKIIGDAFSEPEGAAPMTLQQELRVLMQLHARRFGPDKTREMLATHGATNPGHVRTVPEERRVDLVLAMHRVLGEA